MIAELPLHPLLVHLPLGLVIILPLISFWALLARRREDSPGTIWALVVVLHAVLAVSTWIAAEVGERKVHIAEQVVEQQIIARHADAGDYLQIATLLAFLVALVGVARGRMGRTGRCVSTALACGMLFLGCYAGRTGGELVYQHGAADAYVHPEAARGRDDVTDQPPGTVDKTREGSSSPSGK